MTVKKAGPLQWQVPIVDKEGRPSPEFIRYFQQLVGNDGTLDADVGTKQNSDADLTAISELTGTGIIVRTATDTWAPRTLTAPAAGITIADPAGVAGNPTFILANDLGALEALSGTHTIYYRSAADTWSAVTVGAGLDFTGATLSNTISAYTDEQAQDALGAMVDGSLTYVDATPLLQRAALTGDVTAAAGSNVTTAVTAAGAFTIGPGVYPVKIHTPVAGAGSIGIGVGTLAGANTGYWNIAVGPFALQRVAAGTGNIAFGESSGYNITDGGSNFIIGHEAGLNLTTGSNNIMLGPNAGNGIVTGSGNTLIGYGLSGLAAGLSNTLILGANSRQDIVHNGTTCTITGAVAATGAATFGGEGTFNYGTGATTALNLNSPLGQNLAFKLNTTTGIHTWETNAGSVGIDFKALYSGAEYGFYPNNSLALTINTAGVTVNKALTAGTTATGAITPLKITTISGQDIAFKIDTASGQYTVENNAGTFGLDFKALYSAAHYRFYPAGGATLIADISGTGLAVTGVVSVTDDAYAAGWNGSTNVPTKNAVYDKIETFGTAAVKNTGTSGANIPLLDGINTWSGLQTFGEIKTTGLRDAGGTCARFEGTGAAAPAGSTGVGFEFYVSGGVAYAAAYNRTTPGYAPLSFYGSTVAFNGPATFANDVNLNAAVLKVSAIQVVGAQGAAVADHAAITAYTAHASGAVAVTSNAATDLDTTAAALATLRGEVESLRTTVNTLLARERAHGLIAT